MKTTRLNDVCKLVNGGTPKSGVSEYWGGDVAWLTPAEMGKRTTPYITETARSISRSGLATCSARQVPIGSVIISTRAPIGHLAIPEVPMAFNQGCRGLIPNDTLETKYLYYFLWFSRDALNELGTGATFKELSSGALGNYHIPLPPLEEQRRTVAVLDEAFAAIAQATANAEKNLANSRELFESFQFSLLGRPKSDWYNKCLGECFRLRSGDGLIAKDMIDGPFPVFGGNGIAGMHHRSNLSGDNVIIGRVGALCGNARHISQKIWLTDNAFRVVDEKFDFDKKFLSYVLNFKNLRGLARQSAQPVISNSSLSGLELSFPAKVSEQKEISQKLDTFRQACDDLVLNYTRQVSELSQLKQSLLHSAFTGELTAIARKTLAA